MSIETLFALSLFAIVVMTVIFAGSLMVSTKSYYMQSITAVEIVGLIAASVSQAQGVAGHGDNMISKVADCVYFACIYVVLILFVFFISDYIFQRTGKKIWLAYITLPVGILYALLWMLSAFTGFFYSRNTAGAASYSFLSPNISSLGGNIIAATAIYIIISNRKALKLYEMISMISFLVLPIMILIFMPRLTPLVFAISIILIYVFLQYGQLQWIKEQQEKIEEDRLRIMLSQISPHLIYNILNSIYYLCDEDAEKAKEAISDFSGYLRHNFASIEKSETVPIEEELDHVRLYLRLEKLRFEDRLNIVYDIEPLNLKLPPLTIQPLVENAVKHGVTKREEGGTVKISIKKEKGRAEICVEDDGVGFDDTQAFNTAEGHIGLKNIRERLSLICNAVLTIQSVPGKGTQAKILFPIGKTS